MGAVNQADIYDEWSSDEDDDIYSAIFEIEENHRDDFQDKQYYVGLPYYDDVFDVLILASVIQVGNFLTRPIEHTMHYLTNYSVIRTGPAAKPEIMQLNIHPIHQAYNVVLKTHWIRLIQRTWKNVMIRRAAIHRKWLQPETMKHRELHGRRTDVLPGLRGMLAPLQKRNSQNIAVFA